MFVYHEAAQRDAGSMLNPKTLGAPMMLRLPDGMHGSYGGYGGPHTAKQLCKDVCNRLQNVLKPGEKALIVKQEHSLNALFARAV